MTQQTIYEGKPVPYLDESLTKHIDMYVPYSDLHKPKFIGRAVIAVEGVGNMPLQFPIDAKSINDAFNIYDISMQEELDRLEKEHTEQNKQIQVPGEKIIDFKGK